MTTARTKHVVTKDLKHLTVRQGQHRFNQRRKNNLLLGSAQHIGSWAAPERR